MPTEKERAEPAYHVIRTLNGKWAIRRTRAKRALRVLAEKQEAVKLAGLLASYMGWPLYVHDENGRVEERKPNANT